MANHDGGQGPVPEAPGDAQLAAYVAEMTSELSRLTNRPRFRTVRYLLDMTRIEAERIVKDAGSTAPR